MEKQLEQVRSAHASLRAPGIAQPRDARGRTRLEDLEQWAYTPELEPQVRQLLEQARSGDKASADAAVTQASAAVEGAMNRALEIADYWNTTEAVQWRARWQAFAAANGLPAEPDEALVDIEKVMFAQLDRGDFVAARRTGMELVARRDSAISAAGFRIAAAANPDNLKFVARTLPCEPYAGTAEEKARMTHAAQPDRFYPPGSKRREEQGDIFVRVLVAASGCATAFAVVMSSGFPDLDQAALNVAEYSRFSPATENGSTIDSYITFKVSFRISH